MYCKKCGKEIDYEAEVCNECVAAEANEVNVEPVAEEAVAAVTLNNNEAAAVKNPKMIGFGKALTSLILALVAGFILGFIAGLVATAAEGILETVENIAEHPELYVQNGEPTVLLEKFIENDVYPFLGYLVIAVAGGVVSLVLGIIGTIFGAQSISCFKKEHRKGNKPIATLIVGIVGLLESIAIIVTILGVVAIIAAAALTVLSAL